MIRSLRRRGAVRAHADRRSGARSWARSSARAVVLVASAAALLSFGTGCEEDTKPVITKISGNPLCGAMIPQPDSSLGLRVQFFARASSGNRFDDPTGANSALDWYWDFDGDGRVDAENVVEPSFVYRQPGDYQVTLTVQDSDGDEDSRSFLVQVRSESSDLDILEFEAEVRTEVVLGRTFGENTGVTLEGAVPPIEELPLADRVVLSAQTQLDGWQAIFDGKLTATCQITDIFNQYDWTWGFDDGTTQEDTNPARIERPFTDLNPIRGVVTVTEVVTGIERTDVVTTTLPLAAAMSAPLYAYVAPGALDSMDVNLYLLPEGLDAVSVKVEYDPTLTLQSVGTAGGLEDLGFEVTDTDSANVVFFEATSSSGLASASPRERLARLYFINAPDELDTPRDRPVRIRRVQASVDTLRLPTSFREARLIADVADCNDNGLGDTMEIEARRDFVDRSRDGVIDYCADCNENSVSDGEEIDGDSTVDVDVNGIPDDCDCNSDGLYDARQLANGQARDDDGNGLPDDCDCDWNGIADIEEIRDHPSFVQRFTIDLPESLQQRVTVPYNRAFDYRVDIDAIDDLPGNDGLLDATPDGVLDFCQDCDDDGVLDRLQYTVNPANTTTAEPGVRADVDGNLVLDTCDCNGNGRFDRGEIERNLVSSTNGLIDDCDCNDNAINDLVEISDAIIEITNPAVGTFSYVSALDGNVDQVIDACVDCDENGTLDGEDFANDGPLSDIDGNFLLDRCDCNNDRTYDPPVNPTTNDLDNNGVIDLCDCDRNGVADLEQIAATIGTNFTLNSFGRIDDYTTAEDAVTVIDMNDEDPRTPWVDVELVAAPDQVPDICQDCNANGIADLQEVSEEVDGQEINRLDLDRDGRLDECDCNLDGLFDSVQITLNPSIDANGDDIIDDCDCNENGVADVAEIAPIAVFDADTGIYLGADGVNGDGLPIVDANGNGILDQCESQAILRTLPTWSGERATPVRSGRR